MIFGMLGGKNLVDQVSTEGRAEEARVLVRKWWI